ncbi:MAG: imidazole glycerol phosphate synthase subunit HisH [Fibrobacterota bacterium]
MIAIVDYKAGNITSVKRALDTIGAESQITSSPAQLARADKILFPGVGHAQSAMKSLQESGLDTALRKAFSDHVPILGICLGTQIILSNSEEGPTETLDIIPGKCRKFQLESPDLAIPHMGWNSARIENEHPLLQGIASGEEFYFVHSYYPVPHKKEHVYCTTEYEITFAAALGTGSLFATQFHPEKSGRAGLKLLENFLNWDGSNAE